MTDKFLNYVGLNWFLNKIKTLLNSKVDKEAGKGLSSEDFTAEEKAKLASISNTEETQIVGWTAITPNTYKEIDFDQYPQYNTFVFLIYMRYQNYIVRNFIKIELTRAELEKILTKGTTNEFIIPRAFSYNFNNDVTSVSHTGILRQVMQRPTQESTGIGKIKIKYKACTMKAAYKNPEEITTFDNFEYCLYAK